MVEIIFNVIFSTKPLNRQIFNHVSKWVNNIEPIFKVSNIILHIHILYKKYKIFSLYLYDIKTPNNFRRHSIQNKPDYCTTNSQNIIPIIIRLKKNCPESDDIGFFNPKRKYLILSCVEKCTKQ